VRRSEAALTWENHWPALAGRGPALAGAAALAGPVRNFSSPEISRRSGYFRYEDRL
jgi:hypothetical protein